MYLVSSAGKFPSKSDFSVQLYKITDFSAAQPYSINPGKKLHFVGGFWAMREKGIFHELPCVSSSWWNFHLINTNYSKYCSSFYFFAFPLKNLVQNKQYFVTRYNFYYFFFLFTSDFRLKGSKFSVIISHLFFISF